MEKNKKKIHVFTFFIILSVAYGSIFFRVENWPFTDWRVFALPYHPSKVFVFSLTFKDQSTVNDKVLDEIMFSTTKFNVFVYKAYMKKDFAGIDEFVKNIINQGEFKRYKESKNCPCKLALTLKNLNLDKGVKVEEKEVKVYDL